MRVKIVNLLFLCCLFSAVSWGQYSTKSQYITQDITPYLPTVNAWHSVPGQCKFWTITIGADGLIGCISSVDSYPYTMYPGGAWAKQTWGQPSTLKIGDANNIYALVTDSVHCPTGYAVERLVNGAFAIQSYGGCLSQMEVAQQDLTLVGVNAGIGYELPIGGTTWLSLGSGLSWVSANSASQICGVTTNHVLQTYSGGSWHAVSPAPSFTVSECAFAKGGQIFAWDGASGVAIYSNSQWTNIAGEQISSIATFSKGLTVATNSSGSLFHLNILAGGVQNTLVGSIGGCPVETCPLGTLHTGTSQVTLPSGLAGQAKQQTASPSANMNDASWDFSGNCDLLFGTPQDPACQPTASASVFCPIAATQIYDDTPPMLPCTIPMNARHWPGGQKITVYFDPNYFTGSIALPCSTSFAWCDIWQGINGWNKATAALDSYTLGPTLGKAQICTVSGLGLRAPCNPQYPFIFVTDISIMYGGNCTSADAGCSNLIHWYFEANPGGGLQWMEEIGLDSFYYSNPSKWASTLQYLGGHEEGHNGLEDCNPNNNPKNCNQTNLSTVMWYGPDVDGNLGTPSFCDIEEENLSWSFVQ